MNCRTAISLLCAGRDPPGSGTVSPDLASHLTLCPACRRVQQDLDATFESWKTEATRTAVPDAEREWQAVRRQIRSATGKRREPIWRSPLLWVAAPVAAAAVALVFLLPLKPRGNSAGTIAENVARVESVEAPGGRASTMVFVDDKSGWLIVWATDTAGKKG